ncbi:MAG TPA: hypothetical protein VD816_15560 [Ohtaekwangia sp.]|nr:hypothetical protein [Ohtaekwangia sp.]
MIRNFCAVCCLLWLTVSTQAQENLFADSLRQNLEQASTPEQKVRWLGQLSNYYMSIDRVIRKICYATTAGRGNEP